MALGSVILRQVSATEATVLRERLLEVLAVLAADAAEQVAHAHDRDLPVDEIALDYTDWCMDFIPRLIREREVPRGAGRLLHQLNQCLTEQPTDPEYFTWPCEQAVLIPMWSQARTLARALLRAFDAAGASNQRS